MRCPAPWLILLCAGCAAAPDNPTIPCMDLRGSIAWEAHLDRPHATYAVEAWLRVLHDGARTRCELLEGAADDPSDRTVLVRDGNGACWVQSGHRPQFARARDENLRLLQLFAATTSGRQTACEIAFQHPRLGDVVDSAAWVTRGNGQELHVVWHRTGDQGVIVLHTADSCTATTIDPATAFVLGDVEPERPARAAAPASFRTLAPGVHEVTLPDADSRSLAIEFADHLVLCETSLDNDAGERLLAALDQHLPGKPVRYVLFGHYHPHYTGGLRPVMARGATVVAPPLGAAFAREIAERPFHNPPDALAASGRTPVIEPFVGERTFRDADNELVAIDIGADSHHTVEYVVFWLPRQRLLFEGDIGWYGEPSAPHASGDRARGLLHAIDARGLPVETLVQAWPTKAAATMPLAELRALLAR